MSEKGRGQSECKHARELMLGISHAQSTGPKEQEDKEDGSELILRLPQMAMTLSKTETIGRGIISMG